MKEATFPAEICLAAKMRFAENQGNLKVESNRAITLGLWFWFYYSLRTAEKSVGLALVLLHSIQICANNTA